FHVHTARGYGHPDELGTGLHLELPPYEHPSIEAGAVSERQVSVDDEDALPHAALHLEVGGGTAENVLATARAPGTIRIAPAPRSRHVASTAALLRLGRASPCQEHRRQRDQVG